MHQGDDSLSIGRKDLVVFGKIGEYHESSDKVQDGFKRKRSVLGKNDRLPALSSSSLSRFCQVLLRDLFQYDPESRFRNFHVARPFEKSVDVRVGQEHLIDEGVEAHPVPGGAFLQRSESRLAYPERPCHGLPGRFGVVLHTRCRGACKYFYVLGLLMWLLGLLHLAAKNTSSVNNSPSSNLLVEKMTTTDLVSEGAGSDVDMKGARS